MTFALVLHALAAVIWVGGMFFALICLRPAAVELPVELRAKLWAATLQRFFGWVVGSIAVLLASGIYMAVWLGGPVGLGPWINGMAGLGIVMMLIFGHIFFSPYRKLQAAVAQSDWTNAGRQLGQLRTLVTVNLILGLLTVAVGAVSSFSAGFE